MLKLTRWTKLTGVVAVLCVSTVLILSGCAKASDPNAQLTGATEIPSTVVAATENIPATDGQVVKVTQPVTSECEQCVAYVQEHTNPSLPGGIATAAGYTESKMKEFGYKRIMPQDEGINGAIMVWDANQKGAEGDGHMAIVSGTPNYDNNSKKWSITVQHSNWDMKDHPQPCIKTTTFNQWGDLYGINFYVYVK